MKKIFLFFYSFYFFAMALILLIYGYIQLVTAIHVQKKQGREAGQKYIRKRSPGFSRSLFKCFGADPEVKNLGRIPTDENYVICMNHQSYLDPMLILGYISENIFLLAKEELNKVPFYKEAMQLFCITIDRKNPSNAVKALRKILEYLKAGESMGIFPEGTRTRDGEIAEFAPGSLKIAYKSKKKLIPIVIDGSGQAMPRGSWIVRPAKVIASILEPVEPEQYDSYEQYEMDIREKMQKEFQNIRINQSN